MRKKLSRRMLGGYFFCLTKELYALLLSSSRFIFVLHLAPSLLVLNSRGAKVGMRTYHGVDGRMLFTYAQLSPRRKEGSEEVERTMWKAEEAERWEGRRREGKRRCTVASERVREKERVE